MGLHAMAVDTYLGRLCAEFRLFVMRSAGYLVTSVSEKCLKTPKIDRTKMHPASRYFG